MNYDDDLHALMEAEGYIFQFRYGMYGWEWDETEVYSRESRVFTLRDSGCSCFSFGDNWEDVHQMIGDLHEVTKVPTLEELSASGAEYWDEKAEAVQQQYRELFARVR